MRNWASGAVTSVKNGLHGSPFWMALALPGAMTVTITAPANAAPSRVRRDAFIVRFIPLPPHLTIVKVTLRGLERRLVALTADITSV